MAPGDRPIHLEDLVERCMGNLDLAIRLLDQSQTHLGQDLTMLRQCDAADNQNEVTRLAHRLKGAAATLGAYELSDVFARIEQHGSNGETAKAPVSPLELETQWARFIECVADICGQK